MSDDVRTSILDAFVRLVPEYSYDGTTIEMICKEASVARRTLYRHFPSKEDLVVGQIERDFIEPSKVFRASFPVDKIAQANDILQMSSFLNIERNLSFYESLLKTFGRGRLVELIVGANAAYSKGVWAEYLEKPEDLDYVSCLFSWITAVSAVWWLDGHTDMDPRHVAKMMDEYGYAYWSPLQHLQH